MYIVHGCIEKDNHIEKSQSPDFFTVYKIIDNLEYAIADFSDKQNAIDYAKCKTEIDELTEQLTEKKMFLNRLTQLI
jgi:hypothetical protein